jgi:hypothetical protein
MHFFKWTESKAVAYRHHKQARLGTTDMETTFLQQYLNVVLGPRLIQLEGYSGELNRWAAAFQPIMDRSRTPERPNGNASIIVHNPGQIEMS